MSDNKNNTSNSFDFNKYLQMESQYAIPKDLYTANVVNPESISKIYDIKLPESLPLIREEDVKKTIIDDENASILIGQLRNIFEFIPKLPPFPDFINLKDQNEFSIKLIQEVKDIINNNNNNNDNNNNNNNQYNNNNNQNNNDMNMNMNMNHSIKTDKNGYLSSNQNPYYQYQYPFSYHPPLYYTPSYFPSAHPVPQPLPLPLAPAPPSSSSAAPPPPLPVNPHPNPNPNSNPYPSPTSSHILFPSPSPSPP